jgi:hypothetical protein
MDKGADSAENAARKKMFHRLWNFFCLFGLITLIVVSLGKLTELDRYG